MGTSYKLAPAWEYTGKAPSKEAIIAAKGAIGLFKYIVIPKKERIRDQQQKDD